MTAIDLADDIRASWLDQVAKGVTRLGSAWIAFPLAILAAIALAAWRRRLEAAALLLGMAMIFALVHGIKDTTDRPRPGDPLVASDGSSFPSAHAAYSVLYVWLVVTLALRVVPGITRRSAVIASGIVLAALIGLSRAYLRAHWLSDVTAGWALGVSCFAAVAAVMLVLAHIRDNARRHERADQHSRGAGSGARR